MSSIDACGSPPDGRRVADQRDNVRVFGIKRRLAVGAAKDLDLRQRIALEAFDQDKVDGLEQPQEFGQRWLRRSAQFPHQSDPIGGRDQHVFCARGAMLVRILARLIKVEIVVRVFDRRNAEAAAVQFRNEPDNERGLARSAPSGEADYAHDPSSYSAPNHYVTIARGKREQRSKMQGRAVASDLISRHRQNAFLETKIALAALWPARGVVGTGSLT